MMGFTSTFLPPKTLHHQSFPQHFKIPQNLAQTRNCASNHLWLLGSEMFHDGFLASVRMDPDEADLHLQGWRHLLPQRAARFPWLWHEYPHEWMQCISPSRQGLPRGEILDDGKDHRDRECLSAIMSSLTTSSATYLIAKGVGATVK